VEYHPNIKSATSMVDYIFKLLGFEYLGRTDLVQVQPGDVQETGEDGPPFEQGGLYQTDHGQEMPERTFSNITPIGKVEESNVRYSGAEDQAQEYLANMMGDAPPCDVCGHITIRNGTCYKCLNCGNSLGCS
jgi:ribonucleoside-diphosphate reductase alpha chain